MNGRMNGWMEWKGEGMNGRMDGKAMGWMDGRIDEWMDGMERRTDECTDE